ncbi:MAG: hypothetical protein M3O72_03575 [Verrucomicrobiota bacterium]|nr:hypothetical protein [Verrucomicrobiota bacterium]
MRKLIACDSGVSAECETQFSSNDPMFAGHFPGDPLVPGVILTEALAQTAGIVGHPRIWRIRNRDFCSRRFGK